MSQLPQRACVVSNELSAAVSLPSAVRVLLRPTVPPAVSQCTVVQRSVGCVRCVHPLLCTRALHASARGPANRIEQRAELTAKRAARANDTTHRTARHSARNTNPDTTRSALDAAPHHDRLACDVHWRSSAEAALLLARGGMQQRVRLRLRIDELDGSRNEHEPIAPDCFSCRSACHTCSRTPVEKRPLRLAVVC